MTVGNSHITAETDDLAPVSHEVDNNKYLEKARFCPFCGEPYEPSRKACAHCGSLLPPAFNVRTEGGRTYLKRKNHYLFDYPPAPRSRQLTAAIIDLFLMLCFLSPWYSYYNSQRMSALCLGIIGTVIAAAYLFTKDGWGHGQSIGKMIMGLMVIEARSNRPCTMRRSAMRGVVWVTYVVGEVLGFALGSVSGRYERELFEDNSLPAVKDNFASTQVIMASDYKTRQQSKE